MMLLSKLLWWIGAVLCCGNVVLFIATLHEPFKSLIIIDESVVVASPVTLQGTTTTVTTKTSSTDVDKDDSISITASIAGSYTASATASTGDSSTTTSSTTTIIAASTGGDTVTNNNNNNVAEKEKKYILYGATAGWSNQLLCLEHAIWITNSLPDHYILVLPPALHHQDLVQVNICNSDNGLIPLYNNFTSNEIKNGPRSKLSTIIDFENSNYTIASNRVIDYVDYIKSANKYKYTEGWIIGEIKGKGKRNGRYNCANTKFTNNITIHGVTKTSITCDDHLGFAGRGPMKYTYRHLQTVIENEYNDYNTIAFNFIYPTSLFDENSYKTIEIQYTKPIKQMVYLLKQRMFPGNNHNYAAIHVRATDGPYQNQNWTEVFTYSLNMVKNSILQFHYNNTNNVNNSNNVNNAKYTLVLISDNWYLYRRTNYQDNQKKYQSDILNIWIQYEQELYNELINNHNITLYVISGINYKTYVDKLRKQLQNSYETDVYLDQQLAICADIGFGYYPSTSTYQARILQMRQQQHINPCSIDV